MRKPKEKERATKLRIYTYQPKNLIDKLMADGIVAVEFSQTNLYKNMQMCPNPAGVHVLEEAYLWMGRKLGEKTGIWFKAIYGNNIDCPRDADGDYINDDGEKLPVLPFWGWYITNSKNEKPDPEMYCFDSRETLAPGAWTMSDSKTMLLTLDVPEELVLLSDANAWYCVLEGRPCYDYEAEEVEEAKTQAFMEKNRQFEAMPDRTKEQKLAKSAAAEEIWKECKQSWDNIFRLEGRRLHSFMGAEECYDVQAVFPFIQKEWIVTIENV